MKFINFSRLLCLKTGRVIMVFFKHFLLFFKHYFVQLGRRWSLLPLLILFPGIIITLLAIILIALLTPTEHEPIQVGLVDLDQSEETEIVVQLMADSSELSAFIQLHPMTESEARHNIVTNEISAYITFPPQFTTHLYEGTSVSLPIVGNPHQSAHSYLIKELVDSVTRHISVSQANILTINYFAKKIGMDDELRNEFLFEQFTNFLFYTIGKDQVLYEEELINQATSTPIHYYSLGTLLMITTLWLLFIYNFLYKEETERMKQRLKLYGVKDIYQLIARITVTLLCVLPLSFLLFILMKRLLTINLLTEDLIKSFALIGLYSLSYLASIAVLEILIDSRKLRLLSQTIVTIFLIIISGSIIPTLYFPIYIQDIVPYIYSAEAFHWLQEIVLNERLFINFMPLIYMTLSACFLLIGLSLWKERKYL